MTNSYQPKEVTIGKYAPKVSYLPTFQDYVKNKQYQILPEEFDVFSEVSKYVSELMSEQFAESKQIKLLFEFFSYLKNDLIKQANITKMLKPLPKLSINTDDDGAYVVNWAYVNYRIHLNFEKNVEDSFYGIAVQYDVESFSNYSKRLSSENCAFVANVLVDLICNKL